MEKADWKDCSTGLSIGSLIITSVAASVPEPYSKILLAVAVGLANGATLAAKHWQSEHATTPVKEPVVAEVTPSV